MPAIRNKEDLFDEYNDYFDTREEADEWAENARKA